MSGSLTNPRDALSGPIGDSSPDSWGCGLIRKAWSGELTELDYLLAVDDIAREGSLRYFDDDGMPLARTHPPTPCPNELRELRGLASAAGTCRQMTASDRDRLLGSAGSLGGTRPKASIRYEDGELAIAKVTLDDHTMPVERAEVATLNLARAEGIDAASTRLEVNDTNRPAALIKRFNRSQGERISYLSAQSFAGAGAATGRYSTDIADGLRAHASNPRQQMSELN